MSSLDLDEELGHAAFFGHWKIADFLIKHGADVNSSVGESGERPLHSALAKAGRPYYPYVVRLLVEHGADVNARTIPGKTTGALMRDANGDSPLTWASDHGAGWGNGMERKFLGEYLPESRDDR